MKDPKRALWPNMTATFCLIVFFVQISTGVILGLLIFLSRNWDLRIFSNRFNVLWVLAITSLLIGTVLSLVFSPFVLRPLRRLFAAMEEVANGNFSVRVRLHHGSKKDVVSQNFNEMVRALGSYELLQSDFVNNFSHEFKTPIVSIRGFAKLLRDSRLTAAQRREYLDIIISESDRLVSLAANTLNLSKLENLRLPLRERFDLSEQIRHVVLMLEGKWEKKHIEPDVEMEEILYFGSEDLLGQVWINLIDNAIKFSPECSVIAIRLEERNGCAVFSVADHGCGMTQEQQDHMFDRFYQADRSHTVEGNGIGLAIVRRALELAGGEIACRSQLGGGTRFFVTLPLAEDPTLPEHTCP